MGLSAPHKAMGVSAPHAVMGSAPPTAMGFKILQNADKKEA
jgi:hypothetical protein